ncbi:MAG: cupin domain-containing protein [Clostridia bacterium]|nr:cupin domain-containing protein [Clostridia bacterium]
MAEWKLVNSENVVPYVCDDSYSSKMLTGDEMAGRQVININEGTLKPGGKTDGGAHDDCEIYYIVDCDEDTYVWLDDDRVPVKNGDIIVIPPHVFHWIDNTKGKKPFVLFTFWPRQEQNGVFFVRKEAWGTSVRNIDDDYVQKRLGK